MLHFLKAGPPCGWMKGAGVTPRGLVLTDVGESDEERSHRVVSVDGTEIAGRVHGQGPAVVLVSGTGDGEGRQPLLPLLSERFTCYSMSLRGRGLSADHPDHSPEMHARDIAAFVDSIGEPVGLFGHSRGAALALSAASHSTGVAALAAYEPHVPEFYDESDIARVEEAVEHMSGAIDEGRLPDAVVRFFAQIALVDEDELAAVSSPMVVEAMAPNIPPIVQDIAQWELPRSVETLSFAQLTVPVLLLHGSRSHAFYGSVIRQLADRLVEVQVSEIDGAGHLDPTLAPEPVARELLGFFTDTQVSDHR
jgi:pimeloyl-ACP methyl ester carboxylesterase